MAASTRFLAFLSTFAVILTAHFLAAWPLEARAVAAAVVPSLSGGVVTIGAGTYPRANFLRDGSILGVYSAFSNGMTTLTTTRSTDGGVTWNNIGTVTSVETALHDTDNPYVLQLPSGRVLCALRNHDKNPGGTYKFFRITICYSDDAGITWAYLSTPASDPGPVNGNWEPFLRNAADGSLQLYYSRENSAADQDSLMRTSTNGGATWTSAYVISGGNLPASRDGMLGMVAIDGLNLIAVFETETNGGHFTIGSVTSANDGSTWGNRRTLYTPTSGNANAPQVVNIGGTLVVSFQTDEDSPGRTAAKVVTSGDGGNTWGDKLTFLDQVSLWPSLLALDGQSLLGMADHAGVKAQKIILGHSQTPGTRQIAAAVLSVLQ